MSFNGSGTFVRIYSWQNDAANGVNITASRMDTEDDGFASGLSNCLTRDGQSPALANIPMGGFKLTGLGNGTNPQDAATVGQTVSSSGGNVGPLFASASSGSSSPINGTSNLGVLPAASFTNNGGGSSVFGVTSSIANGGNNTSSYHYAGVTQGVAIWYLYGNGTTSYTSDIRVKCNIKPARKSYLADVMRLRVVKFDRRAPADVTLGDETVQEHQDGGPEPKEIGLLAQEVAAIFPTLVVDALHNLDGSIDPEIGPPLPKTKVLKADLIYGPILLAAFQELAAEVATLRAQLNL